MDLGKLFILFVMIVDSEANTTRVITLFENKPRHCFLLTMVKERLGNWSGYSM